MSRINENLPFDKACEDIEPDNIADYSGENVIEWIRGQKMVTVQLAGGSKLCHRVQKYADLHPDEVQIVATNKDNSIVAHLPLSYIKITRPREYTEEQRQAAAERLAATRKSK